MANPALKGQVLLEDAEIKAIVDDYLRGRISLEQAAERVPKAKMTTFDYVLKLLLPDAVYKKREMA
jgi:hypothetical protein